MEDLLIRGGQVIDGVWGPDSPGCSVTFGEGFQAWRT